MSKSSSPRWTAIFILLPVVTLAIYIPLTTYLKARNLAAELKTNLKLITLSVEELSREKELLALLLKSKTAHTLEPARKKTAKFSKRYRAIEGIWVVDDDYTTLLSQLKDSRLDNYKPAVPETPDSYWEKFKNKEFLRINTDIISLFGSSIGKVVALVNPKEMLSENIFNKFRITDGVPSDEFFTFPLIAPVLLSVTQSGLAYIYVKSIENKNRFIYLNNYIPWLNLALLLLFYLLVIIPLIKYFLSFSPSRYFNDILDSNEKLNKTPGDLLNVNSFHWVMGNLRRDLLRILKVLTRVAKTDAPTGHVDVKAFGAGLDVKTEADYKKEQELVSKMKLPEGKKTALIDDPTIPDAYVYSLEMTDDINEIDLDIVNSWSPPEPKDKPQEEFTAGKTRMVEDKKGKRVVYNSDHQGKFDDINFMAV